MSIARSSARLSLCLLSAVALGRLPVQAQVQSVTLSGTVLDPSGALVPQAMLEIAPHGDSSTAPQQVLSDAAGRYTVALPPGTWDVVVTATGFDPITQTVTLTARPVSLELRFRVASTTDQVDVGSESSTSTAAADNKGALVFKGDQLDALSSNDSTMQNQLLAMAGGSGEGGGNVYVDGFSGGRFPPKDTIREVRINQNPFSAQYEDLGYGRVEIFTKPGSDKLHGTIFSSGSPSAINARNPYTGAQPPYYILWNRADLSGPLGKKTSVFGSFEHTDQTGSSVVNAFNPDGSRLSTSVPTPSTEIYFNGRLDRQLNKNNTLVSRYDRDETTSTNTGVGLLVLPSQGTTNRTTVQTVQAGNTDLIGPNLVSETRFQYLRTRINQTPNSTAPQIEVQGAFSGGGSPTQTLADAQDRYEFQQYFSLSHGTHFIRFGARYRLLHEVNTSTANYNGLFTYPSLAAFQAGTPSFFSLTTGQSTARLLTGDLGAYAEDEWKVRKNLTLNYGIRFETQSAIPDHFDPAPRAAFAWAIRGSDKHPPVLTLRGSAGIFYQRFANGNILTSVRQNGISQRAFLINNPNFNTVPDPSTLTGTAPTPYQISPRLHVASENIASLSAERALGKIGQITFTYYAVRGVHQYNSENANAPVNGVRPLGGNGDLYRFSSDGIEKAQVINLNANLNPTKKITIFAFYSARRQHSDTFGAAHFPSQPYNVSADYAPSGLGFQPVGQRLFFDTEIKLPFHFSTDIFLGSLSRSRFNITTGTDRNGDTQFNDRPAFATNPTSASVIYRTPYGTFDANPQPGEAIIPYNYALAPRYLIVAGGIKREFQFGPRPPIPAEALANVKPGQPGPPRPDPRYSLSLSLDTFNFPNINNAGVPIGVLTSPFFGQSISLNNSFGLPTAAANRLLFLNAQFHF